MDILVIGATGQICKCTIEALLHENIEIKVISRSSNLFSNEGIYTNLDWKTVESYDISLIRKELDNEKPKVVIYFLSGGSIRAKNHNSNLIYSLNYQVPKAIADWAGENSNRLTLISFGSTSEYLGLSLIHI